MVEVFDWRNTTQVTVAVLFAAVVSAVAVSLMSQTLPVPRIHYCMEQFLNDCSPQSILFKTLKRTMAAEYTQDVSEA
jgi:hypothetical protein